MLTLCRAMPCHAVPCHTMRRKAFRQRFNLYIYLLVNWCCNTLPRTYDDRWARMKCTNTHSTCDEDKKPFSYLPQHKIQRIDSIRFDSIWDWVNSHATESWDRKWGACLAQRWLENNRAIAAMTATSAWKNTAGAKIIYTTSTENAALK